MVVMRVHACNVFGCDPYESCWLPVAPTRIFLVGTAGVYYPGLFPTYPGSCPQRYPKIGETDLRTCGYRTCGRQTSLRECPRCGSTKTRDVRQFSCIRCDLLCARTRWKDSSNAAIPNRIQCYWVLHRARNAPRKARVSANRARPTVGALFVNAVADGFGL